MDIAERTEGAAVVVSLNGRLDGATAPDLEATITAIVERGDVRVALDCAEMGYVSSAGLRALLETDRGRPAARLSIGHGNERISSDHRVPRHE